jgi:hypothetical protein
MYERGITISAVAKVVTDGQIIAEYPDDRPFPSRLLLGFPGGSALHVVVAHDQAALTDYMVTAYVPGPDQWYDD